VSAFEDVTIGECRLILGDCRDVLPGLPPVDLVLTDPPYGIKLDKGMGVGGFDSTGRYRRKPRAYEGGWDDQAPAADLFEMVIAKAKAAIVWGGNYMPLPLGGKWLVWNKEQVMPSYSDAELAWTNLAGKSVKLYTLHCNRARLEARVVANIHRRLAVHAQAHDRCALAIPVMFPDVGEDGVGFGDFFWGLALSTGRSRYPFRFNTSDMQLRDGNTSSANPCACNCLRASSAVKRVNDKVVRKVGSCWA
jgi:hypothetical protein